MRKNKLNLLLFCLVNLILASLCFADNFLYVQMKNTKLRASAQIWSPVVGSLSYGQALIPLETNGSWVKVKTKTGSAGFVHISAVTSAKISLNNLSAKGAGVDSADVVLAGKGFGKAVEKGYASSNPTANFHAVNKVEAVNVSDGEVLTFMKAGGLK